MIVKALMLSVAISNATVLPILQGETAPFTGLLVPEARMVELLEAETTAEDLGTSLRLEAAYSGRLDELYKRELERTAEDRRWYESGKLPYVIGAVIGILSTGAAIWGGAALVQATKK